MSTIEKIDEDLKFAQKEKNEAVLSVLRLFKSVVKNKEIERKSTLEDEEVLDLISKEIKKRKEAKGLYINAGRIDLAEKEESEIAILKNYALEEMSEEELDGIIKEEISKVNASSVADLGKVIGSVMSRVKGRAEGSIVSKKVTELLNK